MIMRWTPNRIVPPHVLTCVQRWSRIRNAMIEILRCNATKVQTPNIKKNRRPRNCTTMKTRSDALRNRITSTQPNISQPGIAENISVVENIVQYTVPNVAAKTGQTLQPRAEKTKMITRSQSRSSQLNISTVSNQQMSPHKILRRSERLRKINVIPRWAVNFTMELSR